STVCWLRPRPGRLGRETKRRDGCAHHQRTLRCSRSLVVEGPWVRLIEIALIVQQPLGRASRVEPRARHVQIGGRDIASRQERGFQVGGGAAQEVDAIISNADDWRGETLSRLRGIVLAVDPAMDEGVKGKKPSR